MLTEIWQFYVLANWYNSRKLWWIPTEQECIPVGYVPSATVAVCWGVPAPGSGGCGGGIPACTEADPPPVDRQTRVKT